MKDHVEHILRLYVDRDTSSVVNCLWIGLKSGPLLVDTPPNVPGIIDDAWFHCPADFGAVAADKYEGEKYFSLPAGCQGDVPAKQFSVVQARTYGHWLWRRCFLKDGNPGPAVAEGKRPSRSPGQRMFLPIFFDHSWYTTANHGQCCRRTREFSARVAPGVQSNRAPTVYSISILGHPRLRGCRATGYRRYLEKAGARHLGSTDMNKNGLIRLGNPQVA